MESKKLTEVCSPKQWKTISQTEMLPEGYPVYGANGVIGYYNEYNHENPTVLITCRGATCGTLNISKPFSYVNGNAMALDSVIDDVDEKYLYYYLQSRGLKDIISGSAQPQITIQNLTKVIVSYPSIEQQKRIVSMLDKADEIRAKKKLANDKLDEFLKSTFISMFGDPRTNNYNWNTEKFNEMCEISSTTVMPNTQDYCNMLHIGGANIESNTGKLINLKTAKEEGLTSVKFLIHPDHILFSKIRPKLRKVAMPKMHALCSADIYPLLPIRDKCVKEYLLYILRTEYFSRIVSDMAESRSNIPKVNREELAQIYLMCPPLDLQNKFAEIVEKVEAQKQKNELVIEQMNNLFNSLSQRAFKGEL